MQNVNTQREGFNVSLYIFGISFKSFYSTSKMLNRRLSLSQSNKEKVSFQTTEIAKEMRAVEEPEFEESRYYRKYQKCA